MFQTNVASFFSSSKEEKNPKEASSTPLLSEFSISCSLFTDERTEWKHRCSDFQITCSSLHAITLILCNAVNTGKQSDTNSETSQFTHSLNHWLTDWLTNSHIQVNSSSTSTPCQKVFPLFSLFFWLALCFSIHVIFEDICGSPLRCAHRHGTEGSVDSAGLASIVACWSVLLMSDWARRSAGVQKEKHNIQCFLYHPWGVLLVCVLGEDYEHICVCAPVYVFECIHDLNHHRRNFLPGQRMLWVISRLLLKCFECFQYNSVQFLGCSGWLVDYDLLSYQTFKAKCVVWEGVRLHARNREPL